ncbi:sensor histidine kinase [Arenimonas composti]|uniref:Signal transduction histidine kinase internal region domain-containing protein n=1 Tax=Arenimonas composti TR7-09 = DSM 18010 TaxID=1121013 RepID=A0A091BHA0_9GAMM|nr:histidine kinase [Arenimonas composti]KFN51131.1 hypothetical protein P873_04330 [Arenimonas composti TR7-09 = DSM 18010]
MSTPNPPSPLETLWQPKGLVAVLLSCEGLALLLTAGGASADFAVHFGLVSMMVVWVALLTLGVLYVFRHRLAGLPERRLAWLSLGLLLLCSWLTGALAWWLFVPARPEGAVGAYFVRLTLITLTVGLIGVAALERAWRMRLLALRAKDAELQALHARIQPHFLFNTLNTGAALVHARPEAAERVLLDLAELFRAALAGPEVIPLAHELALVERYLEIERWRFGDRLQVDLRVPDALPPLGVPALSIQPLVENAVRHGVEPRSEPSTVEIRLETGADGVQVTVANPLPPPGSLSRQGHRVGLESVRTRIGAMTEGAGRIDATETEGRFVVTVFLPTPAAAAARPQAPSTR